MAEYHVRLVDGESIYYTKRNECDKWEFCSESEYFSNNKNIMNPTNIQELQDKYHAVYRQFENEKNDYAYGTTSDGTTYATAIRISKKYIAIKDFLLEALNSFGYQDASAYQAKSGTIYVSPLGIGSNAIKFRIADHEQSYIASKYNNVLYDIRNFDDAISSLSEFYRAIGTYEQRNKAIQEQKENEKITSDDISVWLKALTNAFYKASSSTINVTDDDDSILLWAKRNNVEFYYINPEPISSKQIKGGKWKKTYKVEYLQKIQYGDSVYWYSPSPTFSLLVSEFIESNKMSKGGDVEMEHSDTINAIKNDKYTTREVAEMIAQDHIAEMPDYYERLKKIEG